MPFWLQLQKRLLRRLISHAHRHQARALYNLATWRFYTGDNVRCNCCERTIPALSDLLDRRRSPLSDVPADGSLGRHRVDWPYLIEHTDVLNRPTRLLHIAPEVCFATPSTDFPLCNICRQTMTQGLGRIKRSMFEVHWLAAGRGVLAGHV